MNGDMDGFGRPDNGLAAADDVFKGKGCPADVPDLDGDMQEVPDGQSSFVI